MLQLAASIPHTKRLSEPQGSADCRSRICGSRVAVDVLLDADGRVIDMGLEVRACLLGQASAALVGTHAIGKTALELAEARNAISAYLAKERGDPGAWPGLNIFGPARDYPSRHPSIRLAFEAAAAAAERAMETLPSSI